MDSDPTMRGRLDSRFWVAGHGSSTKFGKVTVTDAELTLTKKRRCSALTLGIETLQWGCECSLRKAEATLSARVVSRSRASLVCRNCANTEGSVTRQ
jgi:hypothetical protein